MKGNDLADFMRHIMAMRNLTDVEPVNTYWQYAQQIARVGRLGFIIRGNLSWESNNQQGITGFNNIWLRSHRYEPVGKHIAEEPVRTYLQWYMNTYEIWGTIAVNIDPDNTETSKQVIESALEQVTCVCDSMSFLWGVSLQWFPASYGMVRHLPIPSPPEQTVSESWDCMPLQRSQSESTSTVVNDEHITQELFPLIDEIYNMPSTVQNVIRTAMNWQAQGNRYMSGLNRFINYWATIELISNYFYNRLPAGMVARKSVSEKKDEIMRLLQCIERCNCMGKLSRCEEIRQPTAKEKITQFLQIVANPTDSKRIKDTLFLKEAVTGKSLKDIRDDIAHGNISEREFEKVKAFGKRLEDAQRISKEIIILTVINAGKLARKCEL